MKREEKVRAVKELHDKFKDACAVILTDYKGLNVAEITELRRTLRASGVEYRVVKNTLAKRASEGTQVRSVNESFKGTIGIVLSYKDPLVAAKVITGFTKKQEKLRLLSGIVEGSPVTTEKIKSIAELPPRQVLLAVFACNLQAPIKSLAGLLYATVARFAYALEAVKSKKGNLGR
ncbi:MAG: 50S ribosomal protein L10 [Nitrospirota bacterium]